MFNPKWLAYHVYRTHQYKLITAGLVPVLLVLLTVGFTTDSESGEEYNAKGVTLDTLLDEAYRLQGIPYRLAGKSESGFDCSGYTRYVYQKVGIDLPASSASQFAHGKEVSGDSLQAGDLLFFQNRGRIFHVGIYVGREEGKQAFFHASSSRGITKDYLENRYFSSRFAGAKRFVP